jgi:hypothetical protein
MGKKSNAYRMLVGKPEGKRHWEDEDADMLILKWVLDR